MQPMLLLVHGLLYLEIVRLYVKSEFVNVEYI